LFAYFTFDVGCFLFLNGLQKPFRRKAFITEKNKLKKKQKPFCTTRKSHTKLTFVLILVCQCM
jgi:hypothetical protein